MMALTAAAACASGGARQYGQYTTLSPRVVPVPNERLPLHVNVELAQPANVTVLYVVPGRGSTILFPEDSTRPFHVEAGMHQLTTSLARSGGSVSDTSEMARRTPEARGNQPPGRRSRGGVRDTMFGGSGSVLGSHGFLLVYATDDSLTYQTLQTKVTRLSIPIEDTDALNTVTKLLRDAAKGGRWAAYATEFNP